MSQPLLRNDHHSEMHQPTTKSGVLNMSSTKRACGVEEAASAKVKNVPSAQEQSSSSNEEMTPLETFNRAEISGTRMMDLDSTVNPGPQLPITDPPKFDTFECFPSLPAELRNMVWKEILPGPREVKILPSKSVATRNKLELTTTCATPIGLLINRESRSFTLGVFREIFKQNTKRSGDRPIYINPAKDIVYFSVNCFEFNFASAADPQDLILLKECYIYWNSFRNFARGGVGEVRYRISALNDRLCLFPNLRVVHFVSSAESRKLGFTLSRRFVKERWEARVTRYHPIAMKNTSRVEKEEYLDPEVLRPQYERLGKLPDVWHGWNFAGSTESREWRN